MFHKCVATQADLDEDGSDLTTLMWGNRCSRSRRPSRMGRLGGVVARAIERGFIKRLWTKPLPGTSWRSMSGFQHGIRVDDPAMGKSPCRADHARRRNWPAPSSTPAEMRLIKPLRTLTSERRNLTTD